MIRSLILLVSVFAHQALAATQIIDRTVVAVNNEVILESDIDAFQKKLKSKSFQELFGGVDPKMLQSRQAILQLLIDEKIINQQVKKLDLQASDQEVEAQIRSIVKRNGITEAQLMERLKQLGTTMPEYKDGIKRQLERNNLVDREIRPTLEVSEEQLRHFYLRNAKASDLEAQFHIAHILISTQKGVGVAGERAKALYEKLSSNPDSFSEIAKQHSDDEGTKDSGGDLGFFSPSSMSREFRAAIPSIPVGQVGKPIKTSAGYHIVKVIETKATDFSALPKEKKELIRREMMGSETEKKMVLWLERKKSEAHIRQLGENNEHK